jgi:tetratricopeptide (TPR) repeat protein
MKAKKTRVLKIIKSFFLCFILSLQACSDKSEQVIESAESIVEKDSEKALSILDKALKEEKNAQIKLKYINFIEQIVKTKIKKADYYKAILEMKLVYLNEEKEKNKVRLTLAKLLIQNFKNNVEALNYLEQIDLSSLDESDRDLYFKSILIAHISDQKFEQALIEVEQFLKLKDLTPSERFKIRVLKARTLVDFKQSEKAEEEYKKLLNTHPNLSKKWKLRSQLALTLEGQKKYREAIDQLKKYAEEEEEEDPLLDWRIQELSKRLAQQPGGKGRLKR